MTRLSASIHSCFRPTLLGLLALPALASCDGLGGKSIGKMAAEGDVQVCAAPEVVREIAGRMLVDSGVTVDTPGLRVTIDRAFIREADAATKRVTCHGYIKVDANGLTQTKEAIFTVVEAAGEQDWGILDNGYLPRFGSFAPSEPISPAPAPAPAAETSNQITEEQRLNMFAGVQPDEEVPLNAADEQAIDEEIAKWRGYAAICVEDSRADSERNCTYANIVFNRLKAAGYCHGRHDEDPNFWSWHRCEAGSIK